MTRAVVTGCAGFIGSTLVDRLLADGWHVAGVDSAANRQDHLAAAVRHPYFDGYCLDLVTDDISEPFDGAEVVFHLAGRPGVRSSWGDGFVSHVECNVLATQRVLQEAVEAKVRKVVYASSSSVYGRRHTLMRENDTLAPFSPYAVSKLAGEHLCGVYHSNFGISATVLRYFTVYGPRQRPDMAIRRIIGAALSGGRFPLFAAGESTRQFTYVDDVVAATITAADLTVPSAKINLAGGSVVSMNELIRTVEDLTGLPVNVDHLPAQGGDVPSTQGQTGRAERLLGWRSTTPLVDGLAEQIAWQRKVGS